MKRKRFLDREEYLSGFGDEFLVVCPRCSLCAKVTIAVRRQDASPDWRSPRKVVCPNCAYHQIWEGDSISYGDNRDWYFRLPLWLQVPCRGEILWAYNEEHLNFLEDYVGSFLRERHPNKNGTLASRLPTWIKDAKNREEILKCIGRLREKIG
ncbi:MAG TPA: hypothetical protein VF791_15635 [Pyrinomonadaceae bacterium]